MTRSLRISILILILCLAATQLLIFLQSRLIADQQRLIARWERNYNQMVSANQQLSAAFNTLYAANQQNQTSVQTCLASLSQANRTNQQLILALHTLYP